MVDLARELDDEEEEQPQQRTPGKKSSIIRIVLIVVGVACLIGASIGGTLYFAGVKLSSGAISASTKGNEGGDGGESKKPIYLALDPPFVVNFADKNQMRFLQVAVEVMAYDDGAIDAVKKNMPVIRNNLVMLLSSQDAATLFSLAGKEKLRDESLQTIQKVVKERTGHDGVQAVYFTSFVMQ